MKLKQIASDWKWNKQKIWAVVIAVLLCIILFILVIYYAAKGADSVTYRETEVIYGDLIVGITESGTVDIGTLDQTFELDMSELERVETSNSTSSTSSASTSGFGGAGGTMPGASSSSSGGGMDMFSQIFSMAGDTSSTSGSTEESVLVVKTVNVSVGQQVEVGDVLYTLEEEGVSEVEEELESNVTTAKSDLDALIADQVISKSTADYTYQSSVAYGNYSSAEYNSSITSLNDSVTENQEALTKAQESLTSYQQQLEAVTVDYEASLEVLANCEWSRDNTNKGVDTYSYIMYFQMAQTAQSTVDSLEQKMEQLESNIEQASENVTRCEQELAKAKRNLASGTLSAKETLSLRELAYSTAQETYDIAIEYLDIDIEDQEEIYADAQTKWDEFNSHINETSVCSQYSGVITSVDLSVGDSINTNDTVITLYDMAEVSVTVTVAEDDMTDIVVGSAANISFTAYSNTVYAASVTEISDATTDSSGNVTYDVTATIQGDVSGLFQGMTGDITFITKNTEAVNYVSNRAIIREGSKSYVKVKDANGTIQKIEVVTGFSDGVNVEILEGLEVGEIVLIESKVSES